MEDIISIIFRTIPTKICFNKEYVASISKRGELKNYFHIKEILLSDKILHYEEYDNIDINKFLEKYYSINFDKEEYKNKIRLINKIMCKRDMEEEYTGIIKSTGLKTFKLISNDKMTFINAEFSIDDKIKGEYQIDGNILYEKILKSIDNMTVVLYNHEKLAQLMIKFEIHKMIAGEKREELLYIYKRKYKGISLSYRNFRYCRKKRKEESVGKRKDIHPEVDLNFNNDKIILTYSYNDSTRHIDNKTKNGVIYKLDYGDLIIEVEKNKFYQFINTIFEIDFVTTLFY